MSTYPDQQQVWRDAERLRIKRTRRTLVAVLIVLLILLLLTSCALVQIFKPAGKAATTEEAGGVTWVRSFYGWGKAESQQFWGPQGVAFGQNGTVWVTTQGQNRVVGLAPDGALRSMLYLGSAGAKGVKVSPDALGYPTAVAVSPAGLVYIADQVKSNVVVMNANNTVVKRIYVPAPSAVAVSQDRLVVGSASGFVIMTANGDPLKIIGTQGKGKDQFQGVRGLAIAKDGTIYVVDQYNNRLSAYDRNGNRKWIISTGSPGNEKNLSHSMSVDKTKAPARMQIPAGMCIDGAGRLVIADPFGFDLTVLSAKDGHLIAKYGAAGTNDGQFVYPSAVSYDAEHDWFAVADSQNARVQIIRLPGSGGSRLAPIQRALTGPLRACCFPLLLILFVIIAAIIQRIFSRRKRDDSPATESATDEQGSADPNVAEDAVEYISDTPEGSQL